MSHLAGMTSEESQIGVAPSPYLRLVPSSSDAEDRKTGADDRSEDATLFRLMVGGLLLGIPIGTVIVIGLVAAALAPQAAFSLGAFWAGVFGGTIGGAYLGGMAGMARGLSRLERAHMTARDAERPSGEGTWPGSSSRMEDRTVGRATSEPAPHAA